MDGVSKILIIEDDELYAAVLSEQFRHAGHDVTIAGGVGPACQALDEHTFDVIVADLHLPDSDGLVSESLLASAGSTPVVLMTGTPSIDSALQSMQHRVFAYRVKPFELAAFQQTVEQAIAYGRLQKRLLETSRRYQSLDEQLMALREVSSQRDTQDLNQSLADYLRLLLGGSMESMAEALDILGTLERGQLGKPVRQLSRHPEAEMFRAAVRQAVDVLERTKNTFKSKELGDLRRNLEKALKLASENGE